MKLNVATNKTKLRTHEGAPAKRVNPEQQLRRSVLACLLWENGFYEDGEEVAERIEALCDLVPQGTVAALAVEARTVFHLRHVPLLLLKCLAKRGGSIVSQTIERVIQRADELAELLAIYWADGRKPLPAQVKKGLARAFLKFDAYHLAKYNRDGAVKLRDVMFLVHPHPETDEQRETFKKLADGTLEPPDTWEVALSSGADKKATFERLIAEGQLGYLALLRNLRNMCDAGCDERLVKDAILARRGAGRVLPFRYVAAARACKQLEPEIDTSLLCCIGQLPVLRGRTIVLVDVSGSMFHTVSASSQMRHSDAAAALASVINAESVRVFTFSDSLVEVPPRRGMAGVDAILTSQHPGGTQLGAAIREINARHQCDRLIVITDEQTADRVPDPVAPKAYMINVATNRNGVGYGKWTHIDGFSEGVIRFIVESENVSS